MPRHGAVLLLFLLIGPVFSGEPVPYGHRDFYPSPERPVAFRADGTGAFPGARPVTRWDSVTGTNIVWRTPLPAPSYSTPVVAGDRVFVMSDPNVLSCIRATDGEPLWQVTVDHTTCMEPALAKRVKEDNAFFLELNGTYYDWRRAVDALEAEVKAAGVDPKAVVVSYGSHRLGLTDPDNPKEGCPRLEKPEWRERLLALRKTEQEHGFVVKRSDNSSMIHLRKSGSPHHERWARLVRDADTWWFGHWTFLCSESMSSPVTDGEYVYVVTSNDTFAAYDLDGKQRWMTWDHPPDKENELDWLACAFIGSLVLRHGVLVAHVNGELKAFDAATGRKLWGIIRPDLPAGDKAKNRHDTWTQVSTPGFLDLALPDGGTLEVVHFHDKVFRLRDGKELARFTLRHGKDPAGVQVPDQGAIYRGDLIVFQQSAWRVAARSEDAVTTEEVWRYDGTARSDRPSQAAAGCVIDGKVLGIVAVDLATGEKLPAGRFGTKWFATMAAGDHLFSGNIPQGNVLDRKTGRQVARGFKHEKDGSGNGGNRLVDDRFATDEAFARRWYYHYMRGRPAGYGNPTFAANRIFYRTNGSLWCIGDPQQRYPLPKACEPAVKPAP